MGNASGDDLGVLDVALVLAEYWRSLVLLPLGAGLLVLAATFAMAPIYSATTTLLPPQQQQSLANALATQLGALAGIAGAVPSGRTSADTYVAMLNSRSVADRLIKRFDLLRHYNADFPEEARRELGEQTKITAGRDGLITVVVHDHDPRRAADIANGYVEALLDLTQTLAVTEAGQRRLFFERQLQKSGDDLKRAEIALQGTGISEATLHTVPQSALEFVAGLRAKVTAQEIKLAALRGFMTESNPEFKQAQNELGALRAQLAKVERDDRATGNGRGAEYISRLRDFKYHETLYELMAKQYEMARLDEAREGAVVQVVDKAVPPHFKSGPRRAHLSGLAVLVTFLLTLLAVFARHTLKVVGSDSEQAPKLARLRQLLDLRQR